MLFFVIEKYKTTEHSHILQNVRILFGQVYLLFIVDYGCLNKRSGDARLETKEVVNLTTEGGIFMKFSWGKAAIDARRRSGIQIGREIRPENGGVDCTENIRKICKKHDPGGRKSMARLRRAYAYLGKP